MAANKLYGIPRSHSPSTESPSKVIGLLLDCDYKVDEHGNAIIQLYISTEKEIVSLEDHSFSPYFYALTKNTEATINALKSHDFGEGTKALRAEKSEKDNAKGAVKIFFRNPQDLVKARDKIEEVEGVFEKREFDIPFADRYLIDKSLKPMAGIEVEHEGKEIKKAVSRESANHEFRIAAIDLETYSPGRFSDPKKDPILMCAIATEKKGVVYTYKKTGAKDVKIFANEKEMLGAIMADLRAMKLDVLVTYNGDSFDLPYIKERCARLGVGCDFGFGSVNIRNRGLYHEASLKGTQHLDAYQLTKFMGRIGAVSLIKFDLETVSEKLFAKPKEKVQAHEINELWDRGEIDRVVEYNREDGEVTVKLCTEFLPLQLELCRMLHLTLQDTSRASSSQMVEQLLILKNSGKNCLAPNKPSESEVNQRTLQTFEGGYVKEPVPGLHENIAVLDFRSLHPTIIISHNISPETLKCEHEKCRHGKNVSPDKDWFCEEKKGFLPGILEEILAKRIELKRLAKQLDKKSHEYITVNAKQHALKILLNSHYGYLGYPRARWYSRESARATTAWSRHYIREVSSDAEKSEFGFTVLYNDTDSCFLEMPKGKGEKEVREFMEEMNSKLPEAMELELDGVYKRGIFVTKKEGGAAKKKYALIDYKDNLKIVGFEYVRRDWAVIAKETQKGVIEAILKEGKPEKAIAITREVIRRLKEGKVPKAELVIMKQLKRKPSKYDSPGPQVAAAQKAMNRGKDIDVGSIIAFVVTKGNSKKISDKAELEEYVAEGNYDADYYIEHQILPAVALIMQELGYGKDDLIQGGKQSSLFKFT